ncbi:plasmid mobilization protein [Persicobacter psychrovividus]|uniref:Plasmid mobilization relaxosome protein MobC n=1 Tax=Persicobacter psychrovividus TaxID=387638 RepID=A0ABM7VMZ4_9BACT|nr:hypothetical protein PEPS_46610 [Persicobacter psychrovividus]
MPRPKSKSLRKKRINFFVDQEEYEVLQKNALEKGRNIPAFCREITLSKDHENPKDNTITSATNFHELKIEIARLGNNLNQIARRMNMDEMYDSDVERIHQVLDYLGELKRKS